MEITLAIVGTAGRGDDAAKLSRKHFEAMCIVADSLVDELAENNYKITHLVSGGAAWADHVAVRLFIDSKVSNLRLFLPAKWSCGSFHDNGSPDWKINPGGVANHYHRKFQTTTHINSLSDIEVAKSMGAELIEVTKGFFARNSLVAKSDFILACTFGNGNEVKDGGTADTVRKYLNRVKKEGIYDKSFHYDLNEGTVHEGCVVKEQLTDFDEISNVVSNRIRNVVKQKKMSKFSIP